MPTQWMCPACARLVARRDRACDHCGQDLRASRATPVQGTRTTPAERLRHPAAVWLLATLFFLLFALIARHNPTIAWFYVWTLVISLGLASLVVLALKAQHGLGELLWFLNRARWFFSDDPLDQWVVVIIVLALEGLTFMYLVITPTMPKGISYWP